MLNIRQKIPMICQFVYNFLSVANLISRNKQTTIYALNNNTEHMAHDELGRELERRANYNKYGKAQTKTWVKNTQK